MLERARQELLAFMEQSGKPQKQISKELGLSTSVISQFLSGTYTGNNDEVAKDILQYLSVSKGRLNSVQTSFFYENLQNTRSVLFACNYAHTKNDMTLVSGDAGAGKTTALEFYAQNNTGVIMVTANSCTTSPNAILKLICNKISKQTPGNKAAMMELIVKTLTDSNRLLIIDEADHLSLQAMQAIRNINDLAHIGIVLSGNDKIYTQMVQGRRVGEFEQIRTRIIVRQRVHNSFNVEEIKGIFPDLSQECQSFLLTVAERESLRTAIKICDVAMDFSIQKGQKLSAKILRDTQRQLLGVSI